MLPPTPIQNNGEPDNTSSAQAQINARTPASNQGAKRGNQRRHRCSTSDHNASNAAAHMPQTNQRVIATGRLKRAGTPIQVSGCKDSSQAWLTSTASRPHTAHQRVRSANDHNNASAGSIRRGPPKEGASPASTPPRTARQPNSSR